MYRVLYRKWRPNTFSDVVGQTEIVAALHNQILHDKVGHAYLFTGTRGTGKTTCAKIFAKAVNCIARNGADPCNECAVCVGIDNGSILDVVEIDAASNNGVDNIRDLREETAYTPSAGRYKVYIIDEVHMLSIAAFNALLKIMEEPPSHVIFILATTEIHKVPATILSRCQRYDFTRLSVQDIANRLLYVAGEENLQLTPDAAQLIARLADGAMRDALSILDTCAGTQEAIDETLVRRMAGVTDKSYLFDLSAAIAVQDAPNALKLIAQLREQSIDMKRLCDELILHYRNLLLASVAGGAKLLTGVSAEDEARYAQIATSTPQAQTVRAMKALSDALDKMGKGVDPRIDLELAVFSLCQTEVLPVVAQQPVAAPVQTAPQAFASTQAVQSTPQAFTSAPVAPTPQPVVATPVVPTVPQPAVPVQPAQPAQQGGKPQRREMTEWDSVVDLLKTKDPSLYPYLKSSKAYQEGKRVLIDGSEFFLEYIRANALSRDTIKQAIYEITGSQYSIGPYPKAVVQQAPTISADDSLAHLAQMGVPVVYETE